MLTLLPTPIGNLKDMTWRALEALVGCDVLLCEDVRITKRLLFLLEQQTWAQGILQTSSKPLKQKSFMPLHSHNQEAFLKQVKPSFFSDQHVIFASDAGMPCVSDPGARLVSFAQEHKIAYEVLPGASACVGAYSASGFELAEFYFVGFLPPKLNDRRAKIANLLASQPPVLIFYESPQRLLDTLEDLAQLASQSVLFAIKEMTKLHERFFKGGILEVSQQIKALDRKSLQGEWVLVLENREKREPSLSLSSIEQMELPPKIKAKLMAKMLGVSPKEVYTPTRKEG
ncbi:rRNA small subunit methyltransferase I [Helicobacter bizzozeronii CIII-1]|uniref:Ribosomal RNA small subunit methyltransferase I n=1 Tax=Helicobacter bizzozeronii (strain CIII-1) TaxID=1002804 RepID=F8KUC5_HELBC|nr:16S rRNA (cytidine(1402)-2'-O)-methyltransferase [Helicobacter bizzozeronii]CCB80480.1 rRNA small subunit methyltransferase I [Helicobacter bizzozeronii CIII-1]